MMPSLFLNATANKMQRVRGLKAKSAQVGSQSNTDSPTQMEP